MSEADVEIQEELAEVQEESVSQPTPDDVEVEESEEQPEVDKESGAYKAGMEAMQAKMQEALNKRISKEVGRRKSVENQFTQMRSEFDEIKKSLHKDKPEPKLEDYETEQAFVSAMIDHRMPQVKQPQTPQHQPTTLEMDFNHREVEYAKSHPGYYDNLSNLNPFLSKDLKDSLYASGPETADYLSQNVWEAERIAALPPGAMGREIALLEQKFKREQPLPKKAKSKPAPVTESSGGTSTSKNIADMSQAEYNRYMANPSKW